MRSIAEVLAENTLRYIGVDDCQILCQFHDLSTFSEMRQNSLS